MSSSEAGVAANAWRYRSAALSLSAARADRAGDTNDIAIRAEQIHRMIILCCLSIVPAEWGPLTPKSSMWRLAHGRGRDARAAYHKTIPLFWDRVPSYLQV